MFLPISISGRIFCIRKSFLLGKKVNSSSTFYLTRREQDPATSISGGRNCDKHSAFFTFVSHSIINQSYHKERVFSDTQISLERDVLVAEFLPADHGGAAVDIIKQYIQDAKKTYGQIFLLRAYEEMSFKEIGDIFGKSDNWARVNYYRAKVWIRRRMELNEGNL